VQVSSFVDLSMQVGRKLREERPKVADRRFGAIIHLVLILPDES
jgi:hypothetical protein